MGSLIGGFLMKAFGTRQTFQIFAVATLITGFCYFLFNILYLSKKSRDESNEIGKKDCIKEKSESMPEKITVTKDSQEKVSCQEPELKINHFTNIAECINEKKEESNKNNCENETVRRRHSNTSNSTVEMKNEKNNL